MKSRQASNLPLDLHVLLTRKLNVGLMETRGCDGASSTEIRRQMYGGYPPPLAADGAAGTALTVHLRDVSAFDIYTFERQQLSDS